MINCPKCSGTSGVLQTRLQPNNTMLRRRRCKDCGHRWSTREINNLNWKDAYDDAKKQPDKKPAPISRGFTVPDHLKDEFRYLRRNKGVPSREAARMLGILK